MKLSTFRMTSISILALLLLLYARILLANIRFRRLIESHKKEYTTLHPFQYQGEQPTDIPALSEAGAKSAHQSNLPTSESPSDNIHTIFFPSYELVSNRSKIKGSPKSARSNKKSPRKSHIPTATELADSISWSRFCKTFHKSNLEFAPFADKFSVKPFIAKATPNLSFAKTYAHVDYAENITDALLETLPDKFLMKAAHMSGGIIIVKDKKDNAQLLKRPKGMKGGWTWNPKKEVLAQYLRRWCGGFMDFNYEELYEEMFYKNIKHRCIFEEVLDMGDDLQDFKVFMFHGKPMIVEIVGKRFSGQSYVTYKTPYSWKDLPFTLASKFAKKANTTGVVPTRPSFVDELLDYSKTLYNRVQETVNISHVRVDFFVYKNIYTFAELTFTHSACASLFEEDLGNKFYGFVASHPELDVDPDSVFSGYS